LERRGLDEKKKGPTWTLKNKRKTPNNPQKKLNRYEGPKRETPRLKKKDTRQVWESLF